MANNYVRSVTSGAVIITGASSGIGEACALSLDKLGFRVFAGVRKEADGNKLKQAASGRLTPVVLDITDEASIKAAVETVAAGLGTDKLIGLLNNAGIAIAGPLEFLSLADLRKQFEVNVIGQIAVTQAFLPLLRKGTGRIVFTGSAAGRSTSAITGPYAGSKHALEALGDALRQELMQWGLEVSIIEPGAVATPIWDKANVLERELNENLSVEAHQMYGPMLKAAGRIARAAPKTAMPVSKVSDAVEHALTAKKPKTRYLLGRDARLQVLSMRLPDRLRDKLVAALLKRLGKDRN